MTFKKKRIQKLHQIAYREEKLLVSYKWDDRIDFSNTREDLTISDDDIYLEANLGNSEGEAIDVKMKHIISAFIRMYAYY